MKSIAMNIAGILTYSITGPWRHFQRWLRVGFIKATISGLEDDLRILKGMPVLDEKAEKQVREELEANKRALYLATRKGNA